MSDYWKKKLDELNQNNAKTSSGSSRSGDYWKKKLEELEEEERKKKAAKDNVAPAKKKDEDDGLDFFQKGSFEDGYQFGDVTRAILGTAGDLTMGVVKGGAKMVGGVIDAGTYGVAGIADAVGADNFAGELRVKARENTIDNAFKGIDDQFDQYSLLGRTSDAVAEGLGQVGTIILTGGLAGAAGLGAAAATAITTGAMGVSSVGSGMSEAYEGGATDEEAAVYGLIKGVVDAGSELIFGGLGKTVKALGISHGLSSLDDVFAQKLASKIANQTAKNFVEFGVKASAEGVEEVLAGLGSAVGKKLTYMDDKELSQLVKDENLLEQFVVGAVTSGIAQSGIVPGMKNGSLREANQTGRDFISGLSENEQKVVDKEYENRLAEEDRELSKKEKDKLYDEVLNDLEEGGISIDTIEEVLGGDRYQNYKSVSEHQDAVKAEHDTLNQMKQGEMTGEQLDRLAELKAQLKTFEETNERGNLKDQMSQEVFGLAKDSKLVESYNERGRRSQAFEADLSKYYAKQQEVIKKAVESGILNNTRRTHKFVDMISKISADKGVLFDFANNAKLKESGFAIDGKTVNGFVTKDGVTLNIDSAKALNSVVGHEITHVLEGTELYTELQNVMKAYAESKGEYQSRYDSIAELYKDIQDADIDAELTADLVGDYLFTDTDFINHLSTKSPKGFMKLWDEVKYLAKVATAGSKEARQLEKVKRAFEKAYKENGNGVDGIKHSLTIKHADGTVEELADARGLTNEQAIGYLNQAKSGKLQGHSYIPVRKDTPQVIIDTMAEVGESVGNHSLVMQVRKAQQSMSDSKSGRRAGKYGNNVRSHALSAEQIVDIMNGLDNPSMAIQQTNRTDPNGNPLPNNVVFFVEYDNNGKESVAVIEFDSSIDPEFIGTEYGDTNYHTVVTVFEPDVERNGEPFDYAEELLSNPDNIELEIKRGQSEESATQANQPNTFNELSSFNERVPQNGKSVNGKLSLSKDSDGRELSPAVQKRFGNSKVVDENGDLKIVYHGTATGEFSIFDKAKGSVEGDFGSGFYFTDNEADVSEHYEGGGPDFDNKVGRRADEIWGEEPDIEYEEAERRAREELYKGSHKFEVYLNIENPAIVGETTLFEQDSYLEQYNEEDYDDYDDYIADVEQMVADDIENIVWEVEKNVDVYNVDGLSDILFEAYYEGGIGIEELKSKINNLYLEDSEGNLVANEVTRQIIESLGYDGIIDPTVSGKWNMDIEEGTSHYIVFKPNQIKAVTNQNPTDNPDIHRSLSNADEAPIKRGKYNVYGKDIALNATPNTDNVMPNTENVMESDMLPDDLAPTPESEEEARERLASLEDADMPPETEAPYSENNPVTVDDPFENRYIEDVGDRKVKAYMYENPEVKPFFQEEAKFLLNELDNSTKGERKWVWGDFGGYGVESNYRVYGEKRNTSEDIAYLLDTQHYTYDQIRKGINAIIEDNGAENNAVSKRIEFILNDRLLYGYTDFQYGEDIPPNQDYINLLNEKQITEYSKEAFDAFMANADSYAPPVDDIAPVANQNADIAPVKEAYEAIKPKPVKEPKMAKATPQEQARAEIMVEEPKVEKKKSGVLSKVKNLLLDNGMIFEDIALKTGNRELQARWNSIRYADGKAQHLMEKGNASTSSLKSIRETVEKSGKVKEFYEYLYHLHNVDRMNLEDRYEDVENKPVFGYNVTSEMSRDTATKLEQANPEFKRYAKEVYGYLNHLRELMVESGVISRETANLWAEMYPHYVPIRRDGDTGLNVNVPLDTGRTGVNAPVKSATGGNRNILPLFDTMGQRTMQTYKAIAKNRFGVELKNTLGTTIDSEAFGLDEAIDSVDTQDGLLQEGKNGRSPTFTVFENGEKVTFEITEEMYDSMKPQSDVFTTIDNSRAGKIASGLNNVRRGLITEYNPAFALTNPIKDAQDVLINSQHPAQTYKNFPKAVKELLGKKGHWYREYMENGGEQNTYFDRETNTFKDEEKSGLAKLAGIPLDKMSDINNFIERVPRLAEYIASREAGRSVDVSMLDAARVTTNFAAGGDLTKFANRNGFTFLNASVQGFMQNVRNFREAKSNGLKGWATLAAKFAVAGLPSILLNHLMWEDDEEYEELSDYVKQNYYVVAKYGDGQFVRIPKGRTLAVIQNGFEQMENLITGNDEADLGTFTELLISNLAPNNPLDNNIIAPIAQALQNRTWYGEDLVPTRLQDKPAAEQYDESTDALSKWLGETFNISPYKINYVLDQYSGGVGDTLLPYLTQEAERGQNSLFAPILDKFTTDSVMNNQNVSDFYNMKDELAVNANSDKATDEDVLMSKYMNSVNSDLGKLYGEKRKIQNSDLPDAEKYKAVREIQKQIDALAAESLNTYDNIHFEDDHAIIGDKYYKQNEEGEWQKLSDDQAVKYEVTSAAGDAPYASDGEHNYYWYEPGEDSDAEPGWRKITDEQLEKQNEVTKALGISPETYWGNKDEYDFAYKYPEKYSVAKSVGGYDAYKGYSSELYDIKADKDSNGKSISGSRKEKVADYINNLNADYYTKIILFKNEYNADDTYNEEIISYIDGRKDFSFEEKLTILKELGFTVSSNGTISW